MNIRLKDWEDGLQKVNVTKLLRDQGGLGLTESKHTVDDLLDGKEISVFVNLNLQATEELLEKMRGMGVVCEVDYS